MNALSEKYEAVARRVLDMRPVVEPLRDLFREGKREHLLRGEDVLRVAYAPPAPATIRRRGPGTILVPHGDASRLIKGLSFHIDTSPALVIVHQSWPYDWVRYHKEGTSRMPRREPGGFRVEDRTAALRLIESYAFGL